MRFSGVDGRTYPNIIVQSFFSMLFPFNFASDIDLLFLQATQLDTMVLFFQ